MYEDEISVLSKEEQIQARFKRSSMVKGNMRANNTLRAMNSQCTLEPGSLDGSLVTKARSTPQAPSRFRYAQRKSTTKLASIIEDGAESPKYAAKSKRKSVIYSRRDKKKINRYVDTLNNIKNSENNKAVLIQKYLYVYPLIAFAIFQCSINIFA